VFANLMSVEKAMMAFVGVEKAAKGNGYRPRVN
jgi:hypothetical protein